VSSELSEALQRRDQDILNALDLVTIVKDRLRDMRTEAGRQDLMNRVVPFCAEYELEVPIMQAHFVRPGRPRRNDPPSDLTNEHIFAWSCSWE
jgi:hypothetical protein